MNKRATAIYAASCWLFAALACGGKAQSSAAESVAGTDQGGVVSSTGGATSSGSASIAGGGSNAVEETQPFYLDDVLPWFDGNGWAQFPSAPQDEILHVALEQTPAQATLSTHNVFDLPTGITRVEFSARASAPFRLLVSASDSIQAYDYFAARDSGVRWPIAGVDVGTAWQTFQVRLDAMQPPDTTDDGIPSFWLAFVIDAPGPVELWLDDVSFK
jgi:hypothetical protein